MNGTGMPVSQISISKNVSTIAIQHPMFNEKPVIPIAFLIHERKYQICHEQFIELVKGKISKLNKKNINVVTDRERGIINAFEEQLTNANVLICWNHILNDVKFWVKKHGGRADDIKVYEMNIRTLLQCPNEIEYEQNCEDMKLKWSEAFVTYFKDHIHDTITKYAARWILESKGIYNPYSGITNNVSESLNAQLKRLIDRKEKRIDEIVLFLYYMQGNALSNLILAFCGESEWTIKTQFKYAALDPDTVTLPKNVCHPDKIIDLIRGELTSLVENTSNVSSNISEEQQQFNKQSEMKDDQIKKSNGPLSQKSLATKIIIDNDIVLVPQMGAFMVKGTRDKNHSVTLFPKETCTCPSTSRCYHIMAAMMAIGMPLPDDKKVYNLTQLRKNCRPKHQKKCGTKKGRKGDTELEETIIPAPDSVVKSAKKSDVCGTPVTSRQTKSNTPTVKKSLFEVTQTPKSFSNSTPKTPRSILKIRNNSRISESGKKRKLQFEDNNCLKMQKIEAELSDISENIDFVEFENSRDESNDLPNSPTLNIQWWIEELQLTIEDKYELSKGGKLNSHHMEAVNKLLRKQVGSSVNGLQLTEKVPFFNESENRWITKFPFDPVEQSPACQIHHTHKDHWVVSLYHNNQVYLLDSLGIERNFDRIIPDGLKIQLSQMYGRKVKCLTIHLPSVMKQTNNVDCGLFAVAYATSYCIRKTICNDLIFDTKALRTHLLNCFENKHMTEFPLTNKTLGVRRRKGHRIVALEQYCICNMPECTADMVECDKCLSWFHKFCVNAPCDVSRLEEFKCGFC